MNDVTIQTSLLPFKKEFETSFIGEGSTIEDVMNKVKPFKIEGCDIVVTVDNEVVESDNWADINLTKDMVVGINVIPTGGGGKKSAFALVLTVAATLTAQYYASAYIQSVGGLAAATTGQKIVAGLIQVGIGMIGALAASALSSVPKQTASTSESPTQFIEGASNSINRYGVIPVNLGTNRMFPPQAVLPYTETVGNNQYVRQVFTYGYGEHVIFDRQLGETDLTEFSDIEMEDKLDGNLNEGISLYANDVNQENLNVTVSQSEGYIIRTTAQDADECDVDLTFIQGLAYYNSQEGKQKAEVKFEITFAPTGTGEWSAGDVVKDVDAQSFEFVKNVKDFCLNNRCLAVYLNKETGEVGSFYTDVRPLGSGGEIYQGPVRSVLGTPPPTTFKVGAFLNLPNNCHVLSVIFAYQLEPASGPFTYHWYSVDYRSSLVGEYIENSTDFPVTYDEVDTVSIGAGSLLPEVKTVSAATTQTLRKVFHFRFPSRGQYDVRIKRITDDSIYDQLLDEATWTALRSVTHINPIAKSDISGTAIRMKASDQLSGAIDKYNALVSTLVTSYDPVLDTWVEGRTSSNPADLFRYVLQSKAFVKRIPDEKIDLDNLKEWWVYCDENNLTYNRVIDYSASIDDVLNDICAAGVATLHRVYNIYGVIIDNEKPLIKGIVTPRNSWSYKGAISYPEIPDALRVSFRNADEGYEVDERIVYNDGFDASNAELYERLEFQSCTNSELAYWYGRRYFATAKLQPEIHTFNMDFENLTFGRGDRITLVNDCILVGVGQGRIKSFTLDVSGNATGFTIDDYVDIPTTDKFAVRIRNNNGADITYHLLDTVVDETNTFTFDTPIAVGSVPAVGSLCAFVEDGKELDLLITEVKPGSEHSATITALNYAPARFDPIGTIPDFESNITIPTGFYRPLAPELGGTLQSDEAVLIRNSDGSFTSQMVIPLSNRNEPSVLPVVMCRNVGATEWFIPGYLKRSADEVSITGLEDGRIYDVRVRYQRITGLQQLSAPLELNNVKFVGGSTPPAQVQGFKITVINGVGLFEWQPNTDFDLDHYKIKFTNESTGVEWKNSQLVLDDIYGNQISLPIHRGTYLIKAVDYNGNESENATAIISVDSGAFENVVETLQQEPDWLGTFDGTYKQGDKLALYDDNLSGYYYFNPQPLDLGSVYECSLTSTLKASLSDRTDLRGVADIRQIADIRNYNVFDIRQIADIRSLSDVRGFDGVNWDVRIEMNTSEDNITWTGWTEFTASQHRFRYANFRVYIECDSVIATPVIEELSVVVDMPDRTVSGEDVAITDANAGATITYDGSFWVNPSVNVTIQDAETDDKIEFVSKSKSGFTLKVYNATLSSYVTRTFDWLASGYGRIL